MRTEVLPLFLLCALFFVAHIAPYAFFSQRPPVELPRDLRVFVLVVLVGGAKEVIGYWSSVALALLGGGAIAVIRYRVLKGWNLNAEGNDLLSSGRIVAALEKFELARPLLKKPEQCVIAFNVGVCHLLLWHLDAARRDFTTVRDVKKLPASIRERIPVRLALISALQGALDVADKHLVEARALDAEDPLLVVTQAVIACRREDWAQTRALLEGLATHMLGAPLSGLCDALLSWSVEQLSGERRYVDPITVFGEASTDKLRESWPALVNFLLERARRAA